MVVVGALAVKVVAAVAAFAGIAGTFFAAAAVAVVVAAVLGAAGVILFEDIAAPDGTVVVGRAFTSLLAAVVVVVGVTFIAFGALAAVEAIFVARAAI